MTTPCLPGLFSDDAPRAPQSVTVPPIAREARESGRRSVDLAPSMLAYRDALIAHGPATDEQIAAELGWKPTSCCGRRGDWNEIAPAEAPYVVAVDRVKVGRASQARWIWSGPR